MAITGDSDQVSQKDMENIYRQYALPLKKYICSLCYDSNLADDIVSETFYRAIKNIDSFYGGNIFTWLCTIAKNIFFNHNKKKESQNMSLDDSEYIEPVSAEQTEDVVIQNEANAELYASINELEEQDRQVIYLRIFADMSFKDIGAKLGKSENWARVTFFRCKDKLRRRMKDE